MATAQQVKALLRSYSAGDREHFISVALQIAAHAARTGKERLARELRDLVDDIRRKEREAKIGCPVPITRPRRELTGLLAVNYPSTQISEMVLASSNEDALAKVVREYRAQAKLRSHGLSARRKLLLIGPPGCGKTMTASALAGELKLPLFSVQLHGLITKYMGETAAKLRLIFDAMTEARGIYLFDEFDAIGANRGAGNDVGEIRRILNSFLQFLEQDNSDSLILAATNYVAMLDEALFRRFDDVLRYDRPDVKQAERLIRNHLRDFLPKRIGWKNILEAANGFSHADISKACDDAVKDCILSNRKTIDVRTLVATLKGRRRTVVTAESDTK